MEREELRSVRFMINNQNLQKSLEFDLRDNFVSVGGEQLKSKLSSFLMEMIISKNNIYREMNDLISSIGVTPGCEMDDYEFKGFKHRITQVPKRYSYDLVYSNEADYNNILIPDKTGKSELMRRYNTKVSTYMELSIDCLLLKTMIDNVLVDKIYNLKIDFASKIGF